MDTRENRKIATHKTYKHIKSVHVTNNTETNPTKAKPYLEAHCTRAQRISHVYTKFIGQLPKLTSH